MLATKLGLLLLMGASMNAEAGLFGSDSVRWKEEVLLHDGNKIIVERTQVHDWKMPHEPTTRNAPVSEERLTFSLPGESQKIVWNISFDDNKPEGTSLTLLMLDVLDGTPYLATSPAGCIAYNKWGRPNPPYVFFKYDGKAWQRIPLEDFPAELQKTNVMVGDYQANYFTAEERDAPFLTVESINQSNRDLRRTPFLLAVMRTQIEAGDAQFQNSDASCPVPTGPDGKPIQINIQSGQK